MAVDTKPETTYGAVAGLGLKEETRKSTPSILQIHGALLLVYTVLGCGAFVSKVGIHGVDPLVFECLRECLSSPILLCIGKLKGCQMMPAFRDMPRILVATFLFFGSQLLFFIGLKHATPVVAATWQSTIPIFATVLAVLVGYERANCYTVVGILFAVGGACCMTLLTKSSASSMEFSGHICYLVQCLSFACHIIVSKRIFVKYDAIALSFWVFTLGTMYFLICLAIVSSVPSISRFICWDADQEEMAICVHGIWRLDSSMIGPLAFETLGCSCLGWYLCAWANQYAKASTVSIYTVWQPCTTAILSLVLITIKGHEWARAFDIALPGFNHLIGAVLILVGLVIMLREDSKEKARSGEEDKEKGKLPT